MGAVVEDELLRLQGGLDSLVDGPQLPKVGKHTDSDRVDPQEVMGLELASEVLEKTVESVNVPVGGEEKPQLQAEPDALDAPRSPEDGLQSEPNHPGLQNIEYKQKMFEVEGEKEEFRKRMKVLEVELKQKVDALSAVRLEKSLSQGAEKKLQERGKDEREKSARDRNGTILLTRSLSRSASFVGSMSPRSDSRDAKELYELREKVSFLEEALKSKSVAIESLKQTFREKESDFLNKIECLELANEQLLEGGTDSGIQLQMELTRLQKQNSVLALRERELQFQVSTQEMLQKEVEHLQEVNEQLLDDRKPTVKEAAPGGTKMLERVAALETELAEALEVNNMYKLQLHSSFAKQQNVQAAALQNFGDVDQVISELLQLRQQTKAQETELEDLQDRFFLISVRLAETVAQREELEMKVRRIQHPHLRH